MIATIPATPPTAAPPTTAQLALCCLGALEVFADGTELPLRPGRARGLLQFLIMHRGMPVPREQLMEVFWPGSDPARARNCLNVAACELRRALRPAVGDELPLMVRSGDRCRLNPDLALWVDADALRRAVSLGDDAMRAGRADLAVARYGEAADLYRGDLFADDPYTDWIGPFRWELQDAALRALDALWEHHLKAGDAPAAAQAARRVLQIAPDNEEAHRTLMLCHARLDRRSLALRQYRTLLERLGRLRISPAPDTTALYERICRAEPV